MASSLDAALVLPRLLAAGLDPNARNHMGRTPLYAAVGTGMPADSIRLLREAGASTGIAVAGATIADLIRRHGREDLGFLSRPRDRG